MFKKVFVLHALCELQAQKYIVYFPLSSDAIPTVDNYMCLRVECEGDLMNLGGKVLTVGFNCAVTRQLLKYKI